MKVLIFFLTLSLKAFGASCCGGGASAGVSLITGDYRAQNQLSFSNSARSDAMGGQEINEMTTLKSMYLISPLWQAGFTLPYKWKTYKRDEKREASRSLGDMSFHAAFEFLPEYGYHPVRPRGFLVMEQTYAHSKSIYQAQKPMLTDALGSGFHTTRLGVALSKVISPIDVMGALTVFKAWPRRFEGGLRVNPGPGASSFLSAGYSFPSFKEIRIGSLLQYTYKSGKKIESAGGPSQKSRKEEILESGLSFNYLWSPLSLGLSYTSQQYLGEKKKGQIQALALSLQHFFDL